MAGAPQFGPLTGEPLTPLGQALREFDYERDAFDREQEQYLEEGGEDHQARFRERLYQLGRAASPDRLTPSQRRMRDVFGF